MIIGAQSGWQRWFAWHPARAYLVEPDHGIEGWTVIFWEWVERKYIGRTPSGVRYAYRMIKEPAA